MTFRFRWSRAAVAAGAATLALSTLATLVSPEALLTPVSAASTSRGAALPAAGALGAGEYLQSPSGRYVAVLQGDGNFVVYGGGRPLWSSATAARPGQASSALAVQGDGNVVLYGPRGARWSTRTAGTGAGHALVMQDDGNLVLYGPRGALWATGTAPAVGWVLTTGDGHQLLAAQPPTAFGPDRPAGPSQILVDDSQRFQTIRGVGAALTGSSAYLLDQLPATQRAQVMIRLFDRTRGAGISVLRAPLGATDFSLSDFTFDDVAPGATDPTLGNFSLAADASGTLPLLRTARTLNPALTLVASPWSAPAWMKTSGSTHGGQLASGWEDAYARYLTRAAAGYAAAGAPLGALTVANEPEFSTPGYPSMAMTAGQQAEFVGAHLRPALDAAGLAGVGILGFDDNWTDPAYPTSLLTGPDAGSFAGAAFHCYGGTETAQGQVAAAAPGKQIWTTECSGGSWSPNFATNLRWNAHHLLIGAFRNSSTAVLFFNLALDPAGGPTNGGCRTCRGVLTIDPVTHAVSFNVEYWLLSHVGRYVQPGAVRIGSTASTSSGVQSVGFLNPDGGHVLLLYNEGGSAQPVTVRWDGQAAQVRLPAGSIATLHW